MDADMLTAFRNTRRLRRSAWASTDPTPQRRGHHIRDCGQSAPPVGIPTGFRPASAASKGTLEGCAY